jgi:hypothetical protein
MANVLRQEARPLHLQDLDVQQRGALKTIVDMLASAIDGIRKPARDLTGNRERRSGPSSNLDWTRSSRLVFLSGDRGTGKTTVSLSLQSLCQTAREGRSLPDVPAKVPEAVQQDIQDIWKTVQKVSDRVVWLEPLDMENLSGTSNLMAAILARIDSVCDELGLLRDPGRQGGESTTTRSYRGLLDPSPEYHRAILDLQRLQTRVALAWEGNRAGRGEQFDPDTYAVEVIRAEKARLSLNRDFNDVLERLAEQLFGSWNAPGPLFVLPVDDVDLNPALCLELLRLLRFVSVPRLFAIVLGDKKMVETAFNLVLAGELAAAGGPSQSLRVLPITMAEVRRRVSELAANAVRKLVPVGQSIHLRGMTVSEALGFRPQDDIRAEGATSTRPRTLQEVIQACPVRFEAPRTEEKTATPARDLLGFLVTPGLIPPRADVLAFDPNCIDTSPYQGKFILATAPRRVADLWQRLQEVASPTPKTSGASSPKAPKRRQTENRPGRVLEVIGSYCRDLISEDTSLTPEGRQQALQALSVNSDGTWEIDPSTFLVLPVVDPGPAEWIPPITPGNVPRQYIEVAESTGWKIWALPRSADIEATMALPPLEKSTASALMLFLDLTALGTDYGPRPRTRMMRRPRPGYWWALTQWRTDYAARTHIAWPAPVWASFWKYDLFLGLWNATIKSARKDPSALKKPYDKLRFLLYAWIDCSAAVLELKAPAQLTPCTLLTASCTGAS